MSLSRPFLCSAVFALSAAVLAAPSPAPAADSGPAYLVKDLDTTGEPFVFPGSCPLPPPNFCPPDVALFGGLPSQLTQLRLDVYFVANDRVHGAELWTSDGTANGTRMVVDLCPGACDAAPRLIASVGGGFLFWADDGEHGVELWTTDGTAAGTTLVLDVCPGPCSGLAEDGPAWLSLEGLLWGGRFGAGILFEARPEPEGAAGRGSELWFSDGTPAGTRRLLDLCPAGHCDGSGPELFFSSTPGPILVGREGFASGLSGLWRVSDPTEPPELLTDSIAPLAPLVSLGDRVFFVGSVVVGPPGPPHRLSVISTDGTPEGTEEIWRGEGEPKFPIRAGDLGYFAVVDGQEVSFWETDGTAGGTHEAIAAPAGLANVLHLVAFGRELYFEGFGAPSFSSSLWRTAGEVSEVRDLGARVASGGPFRAAAGRLYFVGFDPDHGVEPWVTDGTEDGTRRVADVLSGSGSSIGSGGLGPGGLGPAVNDRLYFAADDGVHDPELWALPLPAAGGPPRPEVEPLRSPEFPDFRFWVRISASGSPPRIGTQAPDCLPETVCVAGALPQRSEVFLRIVGPKPNGRLWPTLVKFSTSEVEVWIEQVSTGAVQYYDLPAATRGSDELPGLFDRQGFEPGPP